MRIANPNGKAWTNNTVIYQFHELVGRNMFELMHRADVSSTRRRTSSSGSSCTS